VLKNVVRETLYRHGGTFARTDIPQGNIKPCAATTTLRRKSSDGEDYVDKILFEMEALQKLLAGMNKATKAVSATMGPNGRNCLYERIPDNFVLSTRDGVSVARQIKLEDPFENMGAQLLCSVANEQVATCGDGTTLTFVLTNSIFSQGVKAVGVGANPVAIKRGILAGCEAVVSKLVKSKIDVLPGMIAQVATISANNDQFLGDLIATAMDKAGKDGVVICEESRTPDSSLELMEGVQFASGYLAPEFITDSERQECVLEDVAILLYEKPLRHIVALAPRLKELFASGKSFLVVSEDVMDEALAFLRVNAKPPEGRPPLRCCAVKSMGLHHLQDLAALTGGKVITDAQGIKVADIQLSYLGNAKKVIVKSQITTIIANEGENPALVQRIKELRSQVESAGDQFERDRLQARLAHLSGGVAIIRIGANTVLEMQEKKDRLEDSLHATRAAEQEGVLPGGGLALARAASAVDALKLDGDEAIGAQIVKKACLEPLKTIAKNSGENGDLILQTCLKSKKPNWGYNARSGAYGDLVALGVIDPLKVLRNALVNAATQSGLMLITSTLVSNDREKR
jgi:chaperonin GroEL